MASEEGRMLLMMDGGLGLGGDTGAVWSACHCPVNPIAFVQAR